MLGRVKGGSGHLGRYGHADCVAHALAEGAGRTLHSGGLSELGVPRGLAVELAECPDVIEGQIVPGQVKPAVQEHAAVAGGEDKAVAVDPVGIIRIHGKGMSEESRSDLGCPKGKPQVTGTACMDGIDG